MEEATLDKTLTSWEQLVDGLKMSDAMGKSRYIVLELKIIKEKQTEMYHVSYASKEQVFMKSNENKPA